MLQFAANLSMMYTEYDFMDRFSAAAQDGFPAVEILFPHEYSPAVLASQLKANQLKLVLFNAKAGDFANGERGMACIPGREQEFQDSIYLALDYAAKLDCPQIHVLAGIKPTGVESEVLLETYCKNLAWATEQAKSTETLILIEPINTRDMPNYFLNYQAQAHEIVKSIGADNLRVQLDLYHCQIMEGDLAMKLKEYLPTGLVSHVQIAGVPERFEPNIGEINYPYLFSVIESLGYTGYIGCEYRPQIKNTTNGTSTGLDWLRNLKTK